MQFKHEDTRREFWYLHPKAKYVACYIDWLSQDLFNKPIIITGIFYEGNTGVHASFRAFDIRTIKYYTEAQIALIEHAVNKKFLYDMFRLSLPTCKYHKAAAPGESPAYHLHFQVYPTPFKKP